MSESQEEEDSDCGEGERPADAEAESGANCCSEERGDEDKDANGIEKDVLRMAPNAKSAPHIGGGHFYQWTRPKQLSKILEDFIKEDT